MTDAQTIRIDIRERAITSEGMGFVWVLQATGPVRDLASSFPRYFETRAQAIADFEEVARLLGWKTYVGVEGAAVIEEDEAQ